MLKSLEITNFKAFGVTQHVPLAQITLIYGPNSAGKSSIIQSILLMRQSLLNTPSYESRLVFSGDEINLGNYGSALHNHLSTNKMQFGYTFTTGRRNTSGVFRAVWSRSTTRRVVVLLDLIRGGQRGQSGESWITDVSYDIGEGEAGQSIHLSRFTSREKTSSATEEGLLSPEFKLKNTESAAALYSMLKQLPVSRVQDPVKSGGKKVSEDATDAEGVRRLRSLRFLPLGVLPSRPDQNQFSVVEADPRLRYMFGGLSPLEIIKREMVEEMSAVTYLGPLRSAPARHYIISGSDRNSVGSRGERMPQLLYRRKRYILDEINKRMATFGIPYTIDVQSAGNELTGDIIAIALSDRNGLVVSPSDVGFGIGQLLPILVEGMVSSEKIICVEQPEIHLHPRLQANVADFLIETAKSHGATAKAAGRTSSTSIFGNNQWIVETHSEAIMLRLQTLIKKKEIPPEFVSVLYVQPTEKGGAKVLRLRLDDDGDFIDEWPDGFFEETFEEIFLNRR